MNMKILSVKTIVTATLFLTACYIVIKSLPASTKEDFYIYYVRDVIADSKMVRSIGSKAGIRIYSDTGSELGDGGPATEALLYDPTGVYVDNQGRIFISERRHNRIRLIQNGQITTFSGNGRQGYSGDNIKAIHSRLSRPEGLDGDAAGNIYVADSFNHRIRKISPDGVITTIAGTGTNGYTGDKSLAIHADIAGPMDVKLGPSGAIYILERDNHCVRRITDDGIIVTIAGNGKAGFSGDGGPASLSMLNTPYGIAIDKYENIYIADSANNRVRKISTDGIITTIAGTGVVGLSGDGGPALLAQFDSPQALAVTPDNELVINDEHNNRIRKISHDGIINTIIGTDKGFSGDGSPAAQAQLNDPEYLWIDDVGSIYVTDGDNNRVRKITTDGLISTIAGSDKASNRN